MKKCKKILLMTSPAPNYYDCPLGVGEKREPLGLGFIAAMLIKHKHDVMLIDNYLKFDINNVVRILLDYKPDYVGIYTNTACYREALKLINIIRNTSDVKIICGGPHATILPETLDMVDHIVVGEGEYAMLDIVEEKNAEHIIYADIIKDIDELPMPDWNLFVDKPYTFVAPSYLYIDAKPMFSFSTNRGCPYNCNYCAAGYIWKRKYRSFSVDKVLEKIRELYDVFGMRAIIFREDNFVVDKRWVLEFCNKLDRRIDWLCEGRINNLLDYNLLETMKKAGCKGIYIGVESGSQRVLEIMNKKITVEQTKEVFSMLHKLGIKSYASLLYGVPGETDEDIEMTEKLIEEIKPDYFSRAIFIGIPKSKFYNDMEESGDYYAKDFNGFIYPNQYMEYCDKIVGYNKTGNYIPGKNMPYDEFIKINDKKLS